MLIRQLPRMAGRCGQLTQQRIQERYRHKRQDRSRYNMSRELAGVIADLHLAASLLGHLAALAVHLPAAVLFHLSHLRSRGAGENRQHHDKHDEDSHDAGKPAHFLTIFLSSLGRTGESSAKGFNLQEFDEPSMLSSRMMRTFSKNAAATLGGLRQGNKRM